MCCGIAILCLLLQPVFNPDFFDHELFWMLENQ